MTHQANELSPEQKAAAELLLGRPLHDSEPISVHAFEPGPISEQQRREVAAELQRKFRAGDGQIRPRAKMGLETEKSIPDLEFSKSRR